MIPEPNLGHHPNGRCQGFNKIAKSSVDLRFRLNPHHRAEHRPGDAP